MSTPTPDVDVVRLAVAAHVTGDGEHPPVVVLHGLFGSARNWLTVCRRLAGRHEAIAPDLRNHGSSPWSATMTYAAMAADVAAMIEEQRRPVSLVGHSMGGKAAMLVALHRPDLVDRLVVVDVAPVTYPAGFGAYARAMLAVDLTGVTRRSQADVQLAPAVPDAAVRAFLLQNLVLDSGGARWRANLPVLEREMAAISGFPSIPRGVSYDGATMFVAGGRSEYVRREHAGAVRALFPRAELRVVREAGHWVHAERVDDFLAVVSPFLGGG